MDRATGRRVSSAPDRPRPRPRLLRGPRPQTRPRQRPTMHSSACNKAWTSSGLGQPCIAATLPSTTLVAEHRQPQSNMPVTHTRGSPHRLRETTTPSPRHYLLLCPRPLLSTSTLQVPWCNPKAITSPPYGRWIWTRVRRPEQQQHEGKPCIQRPLPLRKQYPQCVAKAPSHTRRTSLENL